MLKDVKFKYSVSELHAVQELYERTILTDESKDKADLLLIAVLMPVYKRIRKLTIDFKDRYTLTYKPSEAIAFMIYFGTVTPLSAYENRLINITIEQTDKQL